MVLGLTNSRTRPLPFDRLDLTVFGFGRAAYDGRTDIRE